MGLLKIEKNKIYFHLDEKHYLKLEIIGETKEKEIKNAFCSNAFLAAQVLNLNKTPLNARQVLVKNLLTQSSVFLEINLEKLNSTSKKFLRAYNSSASSVFELETLKKDNPKDYKEIYLTKE